jgi:hypothetical protein
MNLDFGGTLRRAWQITWKHKILWILGILSACGGGRASLNFNSRGPSFNPNNFNPNNPNAFPRLERLFPNLDQTAIIAIALGVLCILLILGITLYVLHVIGRGGLIGGVQLADATGQVTFGQAWGAGVKHFWTVLLIGIIVAIIGVLIAFASVFAAATICLAPLACVGFLVIAVLGVFTYLAQIAAVTENLSFGDAIGRAWQVVQRNLGAVALLAVILVIIAAVIGFLVALPFVIALVPLGVAVFAYFNGNVQAASGAGLIAGLCIVLWIPVAIVLGGILETWVVSAWTMAYKQLSGAPGSAVAPAAPAPLAS